MEWLGNTTYVSALHNTHGSGQQIDSFFYSKQTKNINEPNWYPGYLPNYSSLPIGMTYFCFSRFSPSSGRLGTLIFINNLNSVLSRLSSHLTTYMYLQHPCNIQKYFNIGNVIITVWIFFGWSSVGGIYILLEIISI